MNPPAVFVETHRFQMLHHFTSPHPNQQLSELVTVPMRQDQTAGPANDFVSAITENTGRRRVPTGDGAVEGASENGVIRVLNNRSQMRRLPTNIINS